MRAPDLLRIRLGQTEIADLPRLHQVGHCADRLLDRHSRVDAMEIVEIDHVDPQPLQALVSDFLRVLRRPVHTNHAIGA